MTASRGTAFHTRVRFVITTFAEAVETAEMATRDA
jgi:hypothetical protein